MPAKVLVKERAAVTAGLANDVYAVNRYRDAGGVKQKRYYRTDVLLAKCSAAVMAEASSFPGDTRLYALTAFHGILLLPN